MTCQPSTTPDLSKDEVDALRALYVQERDKRLTPTGQEQYERPSDDFAEASQRRSVEARTL